MLDLLSPRYDTAAALSLKHSITRILSHSQKDTLDTLDVCLPVYGAGVAREFARKLWNALKLEVVLFQRPKYPHHSHPPPIDLPAYRPGNGRESLEDLPSVDTNHILYHQWG